MHRIGERTKREERKQNSAHTHTSFGSAQNSAHRRISNNFSRKKKHTHTQSNRCTLAYLKVVDVVVLVLVLFVEERRGREIKCLGGEGTTKYTEKIRSSEHISVSEVGAGVNQSAD